MNLSINIFYTTCGSAKQSKKLAKAMLSDKKIVCVNIVKNVESYYRDSGSLKKTNELILLIKTFHTKKKNGKFNKKKPSIWHSFSCSIGDKKSEQWIHFMGQ